MCSALGERVSNYTQEGFSMRVTQGMVISTEDEWEQNDNISGNNSDRHLPEEHSGVKLYIVASLLYVLVGQWHLNAVLAYNHVCLPLMYLQVNWSWSEVMWAWLGLAPGRRQGSLLFHTFLFPLGTSRCSWEYFFHHDGEHKRAFLKDTHIKSLCWHCSHQHLQLSRSSHPIVRGQGHT